MKPRIEITAYVADGDLLAYDTAETIRRATAEERADSASERSGTGAFRATVSVRTLMSRCPMLVRQAQEIGSPSELACKAEVTE